MQNTQGILTGPEIHAIQQKGEIIIEPFDEQQLNPASYDLRLGDEVCVYQDAVFLGSPMHRVHPEVGGQELYPRTGTPLIPLDTKVKHRVHRFQVPPEGWMVKPGIGYLMHTKERVATSCYVPVIDGKSSLGRLFVKAHETAGFGDPGFDGQYTLEITSVFPVILYAGMRICQVRFHTMRGETNLYRGHYQGDNTRGAVPSRTWEQFQDDK